MNIEPCVRLGIRISPKISENPADNKNNRPLNVTLLTVSSSHNVISAALRCSGCCFGCYVQLFTALRQHVVSTWSVPDSPAYRPDERDSPAPAKSRTD